VIPVDFIRQPEAWIRNNQAVINNMPTTILSPSDRQRMQEIIMQRYLERKENQDVPLRHRLPHRA
jgi:hypothetical protein